MADDEAEFRQFVAVRMPAMRRSANLLCGDPHQADDLVAIAIGKLFRSWRRVRRTEHPEAYVRRVLVNGWLDEQCRPWRRERSTDRLPEPPGQSDPDLTERLTLLHLLDRLPARRRAVLVLRFLDDLSVEDTAEVLGISTGTVKSQTARGLSDLRAVIGASDPHLEGTPSRRELR